jgi:hypothetical protein
MTVGETRVCDFVTECDTVRPSTLYNQRETNGVISHSYMLDWSICCHVEMLKNRVGQNVKGAYLSIKTHRFMD